MMSYTHTLLGSKSVKFLIMDNQMVSKEDETRPTLVWIMFVHMVP